MQLPPNGDFLCASEHVCELPQYAPSRKRPPVFRKNSPSADRGAVIDPDRDHLAAAAGGQGDREMDKGAVPEVQGVLSLKKASAKPPEFPKPIEGIEEFKIV